MTAPIKTVACLGTGYFSQYHYEAWKRIDDIKLVGVCNRTQVSAHKTAKQFDIPFSCDNPEQLFDSVKPDIIDIITPPHTHMAMVKLAAEHGVDVICQKPFGENLQQARQMVTAANNAEIQLTVHENFRFMPWFRQIKQILDSGFCGQLLSATFKLRPGDGQGHSAYLQRQPYFQTMERFLVHETAIHLIDTFRYLFGEISSVFACLRQCNPVIQGEDAGVITFVMENAMHNVLDANRLLDHASSNTRRTMGEFTIEGTEGSIALNGEGQIFLREFGSIESTLYHYDWMDQHFGGDCVYQFIHHMVEHYRHGTDIETPASDYLKNIIIENAIYRSHEEGKIIHLKDYLGD